ncbi:response regulator [Rugamonas sp.]|uniref:response regulator n=1 Tax=Rugamonas sp. TaxID=1926287 RepID=UPI0025E5D8F8|nr:response regulator [Rugamonas sp.]
MATILIIDDHVLNRKFLSAMLGFTGHRLLLAADGVEGLALARDERPDLVITDILMPRMNGYAFTLALRADPDIAATPVIFYTSTYSTRDAAGLAARCAVRWVLQKPTPPAQILRTVHEALGLPPPTSPPPPPPVAAPAPFADQPGAWLRLADLAAILPNPLQPRGDGAEALAALQDVSLRLSALIDMGIGMSAEREPAALLQYVCKVARQIGVARYAVLGIADDSGRALRHLAVEGLDDEALDSLASMAPATGVLAEVLTQRRCVRLKNLGGSGAGAGLPAEPPRCTRCWPCRWSAARLATAGSTWPTSSISASSARSTNGPSPPSAPSWPWPMKTC